MNAFVNTEASCAALAAQYLRSAFGTLGGSGISTEVRRLQSMAQVGVDVFQTQLQMEEHQQVGLAFAGLAVRIAVLCAPLLRARLWHCLVARWCAAPACAVLARAAWCSGCTCVRACCACGRAGVLCLVFWRHALPGVLAARACGRAAPACGRALPGVLAARAAWCSGGTRCLVFWRHALPGVLAARAAWCSGCTCVRACCACGRAGVLRLRAGVRCLVFWLHVRARVCAGV
jgi:hypothetical protein